MPNIAQIYFGKPINPDTATGLMTAVRTLQSEQFIPTSGHYAQMQAPSHFDVIRVSIASGGGDVIAAFALYNELVGLETKLHTHNAGAVDSAALMPFLAGSHRTASAQSGFLFHQMTWGFPAAPQTRTQVSDITGWLENYDRMMAEVVAKATNEVMSKDDARRMMKDGTNMRAEEALERGLIHAIEETSTTRSTRWYHV